MAADSKYEESTAEFLGRGGSGGRVDIIRRSYDQKKMVRKLIPWPPSQDGARPAKKQYVENEFRLQRSLDHPNIARYHEAEWRKDRGEALFYMDYYEKGSLQSLIDGTNREIPLKEIWAIVYQLSDAIAYCHSPKKSVWETNNEMKTLENTIVYHRDIKPANVLLATAGETSLESYKLCDFGLSYIDEYSHERPTTTRIGTGGYKAPEIKDGFEYTDKCDIFSLGCTIHALCNLRAPFSDQVIEMEDIEMLASIRDCYKDEELRVLVRDCLRFEPSDRPPATEIRRKARKKLKLEGYGKAFDNRRFLKAVEAGSRDDVEACLNENRALINLKCVREETPLHRAVYRQKEDIVRLLLEEGLRATEKATNYETPIHIALELHNKTISRLLIEHAKQEGGDIWNRYDGKGWALPHVTAAFSNRTALKEIFASHPGWNLPTDGKEWTLVHITARNGDTRLLSFLLDRKDIMSSGRHSLLEERRKDGGTPLYAACERGMRETLELLLERKAKANIRLRDSGMTALHVAALGGYPEVVETLLQHDRKLATARTSVRNGEKVALHLAAKCKTKKCGEVIQALYDAGSEIEAKAKIAFKDGEIDEEKKFDGDGKPEDEGWRPLHVAVVSNNTRATSKLLKLRANPNAKTGKLEDEQTPLHLAARKGFKAVVEILLDGKTDPKIHNRWKATALDEAIRMIDLRKPTDEQTPFIETAKLLVDRGGKSLVSKQNKKGETALHLAARAGSLDLFKRVYKAAPTCKDNTGIDGRTALEIVAREDRCDIVQYLVREAKASRKVKHGKKLVDVATGSSQQWLKEYGYD